MDEAWIKVCDVSKLKPDTVFAAETGDRMIAIFLVEDRYFATENVCPHAYALLSDGWLGGKEIECPLHGARFDIETGALIEGPAECGLKTYPVRVEGEDVQCLIPN
ncbi:NAD(P)H-dependent nitrite reductase small subunit [Paraburkholderia sp. BL27I4N3]|uniref:nitrite reductase small subunit NirD n=1 Tax=Paraburkholderia sp. BL27I4N3 TaxID=1938805 RepID=UPI000E249413|nr:nitrite reductase small subunit NirD [Paraburkholderia sp. BL27I4N3]REE07495.1 NAD(P)H-dependent nitrite reductase small subunit [Paraburkholderia sp. BL27I4N3]